MFNGERDPSSFRDPAESIFHAGGEVYRHIAEGYRPIFARLSESGVYADLQSAGMLVGHASADGSTDGLVIKPERIPFISYPYEWCFHQLKDAALLTLAAMERALRFDVWLKDASAFNAQFASGRPVLIDTLSFEPWRDGGAWPAYRQFCQHFLAPLALMAKVDPRLARLLATHIDGVPLDLASALLPHRTYASLGLLLHIHMHARSQRRYASKAVRPTRPISTPELLRLVEHLRGTIGGLSTSSQSEWVDYCDHTNYNEAGLREKKEFVARVAAQLRPKVVLDLGANTGLFSRIVAETAELVISSDADPASVDANYLACKRDGVRNVLPLVLDLANPTPAIGWAGQERRSFSERGDCDLVLALALIHHLAIGGNVPLPMIVDYMASLGRTAIVEFVPKSDSQVQRMLATREDIFDMYDEARFQAAVATRFRIIETVALTHSVRKLYLLERLAKDEASA